jgi:hypothetical protein
MGRPVYDTFIIVSGRVNPPGHGLTRFSRVVSGQRVNPRPGGLTRLFLKKKFKIFFIFFLNFLHASGY